MISTELYNDLKSFGHKILILGDPGQLPPITGESPFGRSDHFLYEIQRQAKESNIIQIATLARQSEPIPKCKHDDAFVGSQDFFEDIWKPGVQVLCGTNKTRFAYNKLIRESLLYGTKSHYPLPGEEIICLENNRALNMFNGQVVTCRHHELLDRQAAGEDVNELSYKDLSKVQLTFETETGMVETIFADFRHFKASSISDEVKLKALKREKEEFMKSHQPFDFAHCVTVHKSQGSQWDEVIVIDESKVFRDKSIKAKWLYTAITRAAKKINLLR
jgi:exodeoxyribonuclease-5